MPELAGIYWNNLEYAENAGIFWNGLEWAEIC